MDGSRTPPIRVEPAARDADSDDQTAVPEGAGRTRRDRTSRGPTAKGRTDAAVREDPLRDVDARPSRRRQLDTDDAQKAQTSPGPPSRRDLALLSDDETPHRVDVDQFSRDADISEIRATLFDEGAPRPTGPRRIVPPADDPGFEPDPDDTLEEEDLPEELRALLDSYVSEPSAPAAGEVRPRPAPSASPSERRTVETPAVEERKRGIVLESLPVAAENADQAARRLRQEAWRRRARRLANED